MWILFLCSLGLAAAASIVRDPQDPSYVYGYHRQFGIPQAARIKQAEEKCHKDNKSNLYQTRIVNGLPTSLGEIPYQAGLIVSTAFGDSVCSAVVVTNNRLLTSAHCWNDGLITGLRVEVVLGSIYLFSGGTRLRTNNVEIHPSYRAIPREHDIAIIYVAWIFYSDTIRNVRLPFANSWDLDFSGYSAMTSGYGFTSNSEYASGIVHEIVIAHNMSLPAFIGILSPMNAGDSYTEFQSLRHVWLDVITTQTCSLAIGNLIEASLCARATNGTAGLCYGDFGGPLVTEYEGETILIGISSYVSLLGCEFGSPSVFTRVTSHREWLEEKL